MTTDRRVEPQPLRVLLAGADTVYFSFDITISDEVRAQLEREKEAAQVAAAAGQVHCPDWLRARVLPNGARGGYGLLIEMEDFTVKLLGKGIPNRPGLYVELRSSFLHTHPQGPAGACEEAICWVRTQLLYDLDERLVNQLVSFASARLSRADIHLDWQGGYAPSLENVADDLRRFIRPGKTKWGFYGSGHCPTVYTFGKGNVQARIYDKTIEASEKANDAYFALLVARNEEHYDPALHVWRLEFQLKREGVKGFKLYAPAEVDDEDAELEAELSAEELEHLGTLPRFFARMRELFLHLTQYWLRLVVDTGAANRSRWPMDPTWQTLREQFARTAEAAQAQPLDADQRMVVRGARYQGKSRVLRRLTLGVVNALELEDASPTSAALLALRRWGERLAEREVARVSTQCTRYQERYGCLPRWVERGMGERLGRAEVVKHRVQMLLGIFAAYGVLPLDFKPAHSVGDLIVQHLDALEQEAEEKGGIQKVLAAHFARVYKVALPQRVSLLASQAA